VRRGPYVAAAPVADAPQGWSILPVGTIGGVAHAAVFDRRVHDVCQTDRPFPAAVVDAIQTRGWQHAITSDAGTQIWFRDRAAFTVARILAIRRAACGRTVA
jgi:hypothetical protein